MNMAGIPEMYEESDCFDPGNIQGDGLAEDNSFSQTQVVTTQNCNPNSLISMEEQHNPYHHQNLSQQDAAAAMEMELRQQLKMEMEQLYISNDGTLNNQNDHHQDHLVQQEMVQPCDDHQANWDYMSYNTYHHHNHNDQDHQQAEMQKVVQQQQALNGSSLPDTLLNMFPALPRCSTSSLLPNSSSSFLTSLGLIGDLPTADGASASSAVVYDPLLPLNLPPQPPLLRELFHSLPHGYSLGGSRSGSLFSGVDDGEALSNGGFYQDGDGRPSFGDGVFEFAAVKGKDGKDTKHFATERQRRVQLNDKYKALKSLVPNPTKNDRASVVGDAIEYINELKRTVNELKILVEKKRRSRERSKRQKTEEAGGGVEAAAADHHMEAEDLDQPYNNGSAFRSSWLHRKSKHTEVDVRITDDEVTVKLVQQKRINCLLFVSKVLDELKLDLHHVAGGLIGDYYSFLFNSKICEGSTVYAHAIANKLIEVVDKQYAAIPPINSF